MKFDIDIKSSLILSKDEMDFYKSMYTGLKIDLKFKKVPVYCVFLTHENDPYFFNHIYSFVYTDGKKAELCSISDRNGKTQNIVISNKENSYAIIAEYKTENEKKIDVLKLLYNPNTRW